MVQNSLDKLCESYDVLFDSKLNWLSNMTYFHYYYLNFIIVFLCSTFCYVLIQFQLFDNIAWCIA